MVAQRVQSQAAWTHDRLAAVPGAWRERVRRLHAARIGEGAGDALREGNLWLLDLTDRMRGVRIPLHMTDRELCDFAAQKAREAMSLGECAPGVWLSDAAALRERLAGFVRRYGIEPPPPQRTTKTGAVVGVSDDGALRRMTHPLWWRRRLRAAQGRAIEAEAIRLGYVHRRAECYASDMTVERRAQQKARNAAVLEGAEAINENGECFTLAELAARSVANPRIRRGELMTRIAGFESVARSLEHAADFWTATCPSRMHPKRINAKGAPEDNPKHDGTTPRDAARYLGRVWQNFRAAAWRRGFRFYGFRIAEPHHDGTPHWHLLIFSPRWLAAGRAALPRLRALFRRYFLADSKGEQGAKANRCEFVGIDWNRGSAAGYVAKYVSKNIDGYQVQADIEGETFDAVTGSQRVEAWAAAWGIRQFQQVGGPPVGVWRELRRLAEAPAGSSDQLAAARSAADVGNWSRYVEVMGGPTATRAALPLRTAYTREGERIVAGEPEPAPPTRYGEQAPPAIYGVRDCAKDRAHATRVHRWQIRRAVAVGPAAQPSAPRTRVNNYSRVGEREPEREGEQHETEAGAAADRREHRRPTGARDARGGGTGGKGGEGTGEAQPGGGEAWEA